MFHVSRSSLRDAIRKPRAAGTVGSPTEKAGGARSSAESLVNPLATLIANQRELLSDLLEFRRMIEPHWLRALPRTPPLKRSRRWQRFGAAEEKVDRGELGH